MVNALVSKGSEIIGDRAERPRAEARILLCHVLGCSAASLLAGNVDITDDEISRFVQLCTLRATGMPMAYITGTREFFSLKFKVTPDVLIPRPDTETLVEFIAQNNISTLLDICTGSGCIAISALHENSKLTAVAVDVDERALEIARQNSELNGVSERITFMNVDILSELPEGRFDMVVSNPPYIRTGDMKNLERDVLYEPHIALDGGTDGLVFYRHISRVAPFVLNENGVLAFEIGYDQFEDVRQIMSENFRCINFVCDTAGIKRVIYGRLRKQTLA